MRRLCVVALGGLILVTTASAAFADRCTRVLRRLEGWTIISVTTVDGEWRGCDFRRVIRFADGSGYTCASYGYSYAYRPEAVLFGKRASYQGTDFMQVKLLVEGEVYDMEPILLRQ